MLKILSVLLLSTSLISCGGSNQQSSVGAGEVQPVQTFKWRMVTTWPKNLPGLG
ncbi:MAG: hypothetical protein ACI805_002490, partial [Candidatus Azotimanducaceae bacterium]